MGPSIGIDGEQPQALVGQALVEASMGPSIGIDGEHRRGSLAGGGDGGFNGAVDWHRRRGKGEAAAQPQTGGFNGAVDWHRRRGAARMDRRAEFSALQWGRRLASTERGFRWTRQANGAQGASMGPSIGIDGEVLARLRADGDPIASMGPSIGIDGEVSRTSISRPKR